MELSIDIFFCIRIFFGGDLSDREYVLCYGNDGDSRKNIND